MDKRKLLSEMIQEIISPYAADELDRAELKLSFYPAWKRYLAVLDETIESSSRDPYAERVQGGESVPEQERIVIHKEENREYQRVLRNIKAIEEGLLTLSCRELEFVGVYWWDMGRKGDHRQIAADELGWGRKTVGRWRKTCLHKLMPYLESVDTILIRARGMEECLRNENDPIRVTVSCGI